MCEQKCYFISQLQLINQIKLMWFVMICICFILQSQLCFFMYKICVSISAQIPLTSDLYEDGSGQWSGFRHHHFALWPVVFWCICKRLPVISCRHGDKVTARGSPGELISNSSDLKRPCLTHTHTSVMATQKHKKYSCVTLWPRWNEQRSHQLSACFPAWCGCCSWCWAVGWSDTRGSWEFWWHLVGCSSLSLWLLSADPGWRRLQTLQPSIKKKKKESR